MANLRALDYHLTMMSSHFFGVVFYLSGRRQLDVSGGFSGRQHTLSGSFKVLAVNTSATKIFVT